MITLPLLLNFEHSKLACDKFGGGKLTELVDPANLSNVNFERIYGENYKVGLRKAIFTFNHLEMFYLNTIEQLFFFVEQLDQLEVCLPYSRLLTGIPILAVF